MRFFELFVLVSVAFQDSNPFHRVFILASVKKKKQKKRNARYYLKGNKKENIHNIIRVTKSRGSARNVLFPHRHYFMFLYQSCSV